MFVDCCQGMIDVKTVSILLGGTRHRFGGNNRFELKHYALTRGYLLGANMRMLGGSRLLFGGSRCLLDT